MKKEKPHTSIPQQAHSLVKIYTMVKTVYIKNDLVFIRHKYEDNIKMVLKAKWHESGDLVH
jgi:predicted metal-dependent TIM-barrel fold hydrolase